VSAAVFVVSSPRSRGSFGAAAAAVRGGVPVFVVAVGSFALPSVGRGRWVVSPAGAVALGVSGVAGVAVWRWVAARPTPETSETQSTPSKSSATSNRVHIVWCPKYRKAVLTGDIAETVSMHIKRAADNNNVKILALNVQPDHVHIVAQIPPRVSLSRAVMHMKGVSSFQVRRRFPETKKVTGPDHLWAKRYFAVSVGSSAMQAVRSYVQNQSSGE
jgi:putative transposase